MITRIISGGQTGVDQGALDFAISRGIEHGGFCLRGRACEGGTIPERFQLVEIPWANYDAWVRREQTEPTPADYERRTLRNIDGSDGTLIISVGEPEGGTKFTVDACRKKGVPVFVMDLRCLLDAPEDFAAWVHCNSIRTLNVAGPRESKQPGITSLSQVVLSVFFATLAPNPSG